MITEQRIACRDHQDELFSIYWNGLSGCQVNIPAERITIDYQDGRVGAFTGAGAPVLAVAAVAHLYGTEGLLEHQAIRVLHACLATPIPSARSHQRVEGRPPRSTQARAGTYAGAII
jgi:hypothetical protein